MTDKPRKSKRPKAMRVTTDASKAKLPRPKRKAASGVTRETFNQLIDSMHEALRHAESRPRRVRCPRCEKLVLAGPHDIHTCYDAKALRETLAAQEMPAFTPSPIARQPLDGVGTDPAPDFRAIPCGDFEGINGRNVLDANAEAAERAIICFSLPDGTTYHDERCPDRPRAPIVVPPPDTSAYPWPLKVANWLDDRIVAAQRGLSRALSRLAVAIKRLAWKVAP